MYLKIAVRGLKPTEQQLLESLVRLSQKDTRHRSQPLSLLPPDEAKEADVVLVDAADATAVAWARQQPWLASKPVVWLGATQVLPGHTAARRPVQWPVLPILLSRAIEHHHAAATSVAAPALEPWALAPARPRILVVDDSPLVRTHLRSLLEPRGCDVQEAESVPSALVRFAGGSFDAVFMDVLMPGVDGYDGCREIKASRHGGRGTPVIMLTGKSSPFDRIRGKMAGCDAYLAKPVDAAQLVEALGRVLPSAGSLRAAPVARAPDMPFMPGGRVATAA